MSIPVYRDVGKPPSLFERFLVWLSLCFGVLAERLAPEKILKLLRTVDVVCNRRRAGQVGRAVEFRDYLAFVSEDCASHNGCLKRSLSLYVRCVLAGIEDVRWVSGLKVLPFESHAWVEVAGAPVGEQVSCSGYAEVCWHSRRLS